MGHQALNPALRILLGLVVGALVGAFVAPSAPWLVEYVARPMGALFLRFLMVLVLPLAASALILGVAELKPGGIAGVAGRALGLTVVLTSVGVLVGVGLTNLVQPGAGVDRSALPAGDPPAAFAANPVDAFVGMFPSNVIASASKDELLAVLFGALLFGVALRAVESPHADALRSVIQGFFEACARGIQMVMVLAPFGVAGLICAWVAKTGIAGLAPLGSFAAVVVGAILFQAVVVYSVALKWAGWSPIHFYRAVQPALALAFSTASSAATLPTTLKVADENLHLPSDTARFVLTVGASANQNGTALFEGVAVLFLAQLYGVDLTVAQQAFVVFIAILAGVGTAGVPGASLPVIAAVAASVGVPAESVGVLVGLDRFLDMCRTTLNVAGDLVIAAIVARPPTTGS